MIALTVVLHFIVLHSVDGHEVSINPRAVTSLHAAKPDQPNKLFTEDVNCVVGLSDGKFVTVAERCASVRQKLEEQGK